MINSIYDNDISYTVGKDNVANIEFMEELQTDKTTFYKITYEDDAILFVGLLDHSVDKCKCTDDAYCDLHFEKIERNGWF